MAKKTKKSASRARSAKPSARKAVRHTSKNAKAGKSDYTGFSGKFTVRLPKSLHQALVDRAEREGVSLNLFVTNALSGKVAAPRK